MEAGKKVNTFFLSLPNNLPPRGLFFNPGKTSSAILRTKDSENNGGGGVGGGCTTSVSKRHLRTGQRTGGNERLAHKEMTCFARTSRSTFSACFPAHSHPHPPRPHTHPPFCRTCVITPQRGKGRETVWAGGERGQRGYGGGGKGRDGTVTGRGGRDGKWRSHARDVA